jgi:ketosteroid isomerase-like protein
MSQENVQRVRRVFEAVNRHDIGMLEAVLSDDMEFHSVLAASEGGVFRERQGIRDYFAEFDAAFAEFRTEVKEVIDTGEDRVVALVKFTARGKGSGLTLDQHFGMVFTFQGEEITRMDSYQPRRGPRGRGAAEVGDVPGERGGRAEDHRCHQSTRLVRVGGRGLTRV